MDAAAETTGIKVTLADGTPAVIRPVVPEDKVRIVHGLTRLSPESRFFRFFTNAPGLSAEQLRYLTEVDQFNHVAWIAVDPRTSRQCGLGIGRFIRMHDDPTVAEVALTVIDQYQGLGLGSYLLATLHAVAVDAGIESFRALVLPENRRMMEWWLALGGSSRFVNGTTEIDLPVGLENRPRAAHGPTERFRARIAEVQALLKRELEGRSAPDDSK